MSWWQEYQGFFVIGALIALIVIGGIVRNSMRRSTASAAEASAAGRTWKDGAVPSVQKTLDSLATQVRFPIDVDAAAALLADAKLPWLWTHPTPLEWQLKASPDESVASTLALLEADPADPAGSRLSLVRAAEMASMPSSEPDWRKLRRMALKAAQASGITATEQLGAPFVRTPTIDVSAMSPAEAARTKHIWLRGQSA